MNFFDLFKKRKNKKNNKIDLTCELSSLDKQTNYVINSNDLIDFSIFNIRMDGEILKKVKYKDLDNQNDEIVFEVPKEVKAIYPYAFSQIKNLRKVIMHRDIRYIDETAFNGCENLQSVVGLEESKVIKEFNGFNGCYNLEEITIPQNVEIIGEKALSGCKKISKIKLPNCCWAISSLAFNECENLKYIEIPANMELISSNAFKGCKNLVVAFLDDVDKVYLEDYYKQDFSYSNSYDYYLKHKDFEFNEENTIDEEAEEILYDDLNIKYRRINLSGKEILWPTGKVIIQKDALSDVKEVICFNNDVAKKVINSGYRGKLTIIDREKQTKYSVDFKLIENIKQEEKQKQREKYYSQFLIPNGGTTDWMVNCEERNYRCCGYHRHAVSEIKISDDSRIEIDDYTQPIGNREEEFFTSVTFYKKEFDNYSVYAPNVYDRGYVIYYPYGARFNEKLLRKIGYALSSLINKARDLSDTIENQEELKSIANQEKQLIELFINGTNDEMAVEKIVDNMKNMFVDDQIREAKIQKDWLPRYIDLENNKLIKKKK